MHRQSLKDRNTSATFTHSCASCKAGQDAQTWVLEEKPSTPARCPRIFALQLIGSLTSPPTLTSTALHLTSNTNRYSCMQLQGLETVWLGMDFHTSRKRCLSEKEIDTGCCKARQLAKYQLFKFTVLISFTEKAAWDPCSAMMYQHAPENECKRYIKLKIY